VGRQYAARQVKVFSDFTKGAYRGTMPVRSWLRRDGGGPYGVGGPASVPVEYMPKHEPYFLGRPPLPPFAEVIRGRGYSKSGWFFELAGPGEYAIRALPRLFSLVDTRADNYRAPGGGAGGKINKAKTRPRATNMAFFNALMKACGVRFECRPAGCWFTRNAAAPQRVGRPRLDQLEAL